MAERVWYPLWDSGVAARPLGARAAPDGRAAEDDLRVALGLLDVRHLAGDPDLTLRLRADVLAALATRGARPASRLRALVRKRHEVVGELAHVSVPDLKEAEGGLRDATVLKALDATWLVDCPARRPGAVAARRCSTSATLLHADAGRATDRVAPELWDAWPTAWGWTTRRRHSATSARSVAGSPTSPA